jgi:hypothetical protein
MVVPPEYAFTPPTVHLPVPCFNRAVVFVGLLSKMVPYNAPVPLLEPLNVSVFDPAPVEVTLPVKTNAPVPEKSRTPPPVVPARLIGRFVTSDVPVANRTPVLVRVPRSIVAFARLIGAPSEVEADLVAYVPVEMKYGTPLRTKLLPESPR